MTSEGHILTAAHTFLGPKPSKNPDPNAPPMTLMYGHEDQRHKGFPRFGNDGDELCYIDELIIVIGTYTEEGKPSQWQYHAELLTPPALLKVFNGMQRYVTVCNRPTHYVTVCNGMKRLASRSGARRWAGSSTWRCSSSRARS